jgi:hypothetical protein
LPNAHEENRDLSPPPQAPHPVKFDITSKERRPLVIVAGLFAFFSVCLYLLVWDLRPYPFLGWVDDYRYVLTAWYMKKFEWLGPFESSTLVKRPLFPVIMAVTSALHIPFLKFQVFFYLAGVACFIHSLLRLAFPVWSAFCLFLILAFVPTLYDNNGNHILRETTTVGVEFFIFALALRLFRLLKEGRWEQWSRRRKVLEAAVIYGPVAFHWGMREEAILLMGPLLPFFFFMGLYCWRGDRRRKLLAAVALSGGLLAAVGLCHMAIASVNYHKYGVFLVNDLSGGAFPKVVGALKSIRGGPAPHLLLEPAETDKQM